MHGVVAQKRLPSQHRISTGFMLFTIRMPLPFYRVACATVSTVALMFLRG